MKDQGSCQARMLAKLTVLQINEDSSLKLHCEDKEALEVSVTIVAVI